MAKLSSYTFLGCSAGVIATNLDAFVLTRYLGPEVAPVFVLTRKAQDISRMVLERPAVAFMPAVAHLAGAGELERAKVALLRLLRLTLWLLGLIAAGFLVFNGDFITLWVGADLFAGSAVNFIIVLALVISVLVNGLSYLCFSLGNIKGNSLASVAQGLLSVPLIVVGAKYWGMIGLALAPVLVMLVTTAWYYPRSFSRLLNLDRSDAKAFAREAAVVLMSGIIVWAIFVQIPVATWVTFILAVGAFVTAYTLVLSVFSESFRIEIFGILKQARRVGQIVSSRFG